MHNLTPYFLFSSKRFESSSMDLVWEKMDKYLLLANKLVRDASLTKEKLEILKTRLRKLKMVQLDMPESSGIDKEEQPPDTPRTKEQQGANLF